MRLGVLVVHRGHEAFDRAPAAVLERLVDGREAYVGGDFQIVEADDGEIAGHADALDARGLEHAERLRVGGGEDRRRRLGQREQLAREPVRHQPAVRTLALELAPDRDPGLLKRAPVPVATALAGHEAQSRLGPVTDERDALVAEVDQVAGGEHSPGDVVDPQARQARVEGVEHDDGRARALEGVHLVVAGSERHEQEAVAAVQRRAAADVLVALRSARDVADDEVVLGLVERGDHPAHPLDRGRMREERDHQRERPGGAGDQRAGARARAVLELVHGREHPRAGPSADLAVVEDARDRAGAYAGLSGDISDRGGVPSAAHSADALTRGPGPP